MIEVKNLSVQTSKGVVLLDRVEFTLTPGVCTGLTGASGSGKTTLLKALMGVSDGDVSINSTNIAGWRGPAKKARKSAAGSLRDNFGLYSAKPDDCV